MTDMSWHPWYTSSISFQRNEKELVWHQEYIYEDGALIGEIFTNITDGGYNLRKLTDIGPTEIMETIAHFETIEDAKQFVTQAGGL